MKNKMFKYFSNLSTFYNQHPSVSSNDDGYIVSADSATVIGTPGIPWDSICFIESENLMWTHGHFYADTPYIENFYFVNGSSSAAGNSASGSYLSTKWEGTIPGVSAAYDGLKIAFRINGNTGVSSGGVVLSIDGTNYYPIVIQKNTMVTTHYPVGSTILMVFNSTQTATAYLTAGTKSTVTGCWQIMEYDSNTNTYQRLYVSTDNTEYPITTRYNVTTGSTYYNEYGRYSAGVTLNPSTNSITASKFTITGGTSSQFLKADGSVDSNEYLTSHQSLDSYVSKTELSNQSYLTSFTETDPTVPSYVKSITQANITAWNAAEANVKANWNETNSSSAAYIQNKPTIPSISGLATETYVNNKVAGIVNSAPETLDTLNELAAALGNDPNFATTVSTNIGTKVSKTELAGLGYVTQTTLSAQGYLTSFTETDPTVPSYVKSITQANITAWNSAEANVKANWNETNSSSAAYIQNKPTIPTVNNSIISIQKGGTAVDSFTTNASSAKTINIPNEIPSYSSSDSGKVLSVNSSGQLVWITPVSIYTGSGTPSNSIGNDGDIYLQS